MFLRIRRPSDITETDTDDTDDSGDDPQTVALPSSVDDILWAVDEGTLVELTGQAMTPSFDDGFFAGTSEGGLIQASLFKWIQTTRVLLMFRWGRL